MSVKARRIVFPNGLRVLLAPMRESLAATVLVLVEAGSEYETKSTNGLSHFLEHMCFKGTLKRPRPGMIDTELDGLGAQYNAFTGQEYTGYWAKVENHKLSTALELVSDLYLNPLFNEAEITKERGVITEELNMYLDTPTRHIHDMFSELLYGDQPAGWHIVGTKKNIATLTRNDFLDFRAKHYVAPKTVVSIAGNFNEKEIISDVKKYFGMLPRTRRSLKSLTHEAQRAPNVVIQKKKVDQTHLVLGVRAFNVFDKRRRALDVLGNILGGGMSSRLFRRIREELGAAYSVSAYDDLSLDHGYFAVSAGVTHGKLDIVVKAILEEFRALCTHLVSPAEIRKAKEHLIGGIVLGLETSDSIAHFYGIQEIFRKPLQEPVQLIAKIRAVTATEIRSVARAIFKTQRLNCALIGPGSVKAQAHLRSLLKL